MMNDERAAADIAVSFIVHHSSFIIPPGGCP